MKGWIKVHGYVDYNEKVIRVSEISSVGSVTRADDSAELVTGLTLRGDIAAPYGITESIDEVLALIEEAEKPWYVRAKEECEKRNAECVGCVGCPIMEICNGTPRAWLIDAIPEEYR